MVILTTVPDWFESRVMAHFIALKQRKQMVAGEKPVLTDSGTLTGIMCSLVMRGKSSWKALRPNQLAGFKWDFDLDLYNNVLYLEITFHTLRHNILINFTPTLILDWPRAWNQDFAIINESIYSVYIIQAFQVSGKHRHQNFFCHSPLSLSYQ